MWGDSAEEGYADLIQVLKERDVGLIFLCMEVSAPGGVVDIQPR